MTFKESYNNSYLVESRKSRYKDFFEDFLQSVHPETRALRDYKAREAIKNAIEKLGREDRIMWYLKYVKCMFYIHDIVNKAQNQGIRNEELVSLPKYITHYFYKTNNKTVKDLPLSILKAIDYRESSRDVPIVDTLQHFLSLPIPEIIDYRFENQKLESIVNVFKAYEEKWKEEGGGREINITDELRDRSIEQILSFNGGKEAWFNLKRAYCRAEGQSMGHCGNSPRSNTNDTILSFRSIKRYKDITLAAPHLTFILNDKGELTESKGSGNDKPATKYHPYIIALLLLKDPQDRSSYLIKKIVGGGYKPENNFYLKDLSKENLETLLAQRPELKS
jgi:hypothetical protein